MTTSRCPKSDDDDIGMRLHENQRKSILLALAGRRHKAEPINLGIRTTR